MPLQGRHPNEVARVLDYRGELHPLLLGSLALRNLAAQLFVQAQQLLRALVNSTLELPGRPSLLVETPGFQQTDRYLVRGDLQHQELAARGKAGATGADHERPELVMYTQAEVDSRDLTRTDRIGHWARGTGGCGREPRPDLITDALRKAVTDDREALRERMPCASGDPCGFEMCPHHKALITAVMTLQEGTALKPRSVFSKPLNT